MVTGPVSELDKVTGLVSEWDRVTDLVRLKGTG